MELFNKILNFTGDFVTKYPTTFFIFFWILGITNHNFLMIREAPIIAITPIIFCLCMELILKE